MEDNCFYLTESQNNLIHALIHQLKIDIDRYYFDALEELLIKLIEISPENLEYLYDYLSEDNLKKLKENNVEKFW